MTVPTPLPAPSVPYSPHAYYQPGLGNEAWAVARSLAACPGIVYDFTLWQIDPVTNAFVADLTPYLVKNSGANVARSCGLEVPGTCGFTLTIPLVWGRDCVQPALLISSPEYNGGQWQRFPMGAYIATSPDLSLQDGGPPYTVSAFEKLYLLQSDINTVYQALAGTTYSAAVETLMIVAGLLASGHHLGDIAVFPGDWYAKTVPAGGDLTFAPGDTTYGTYLKAINELLAASGARPLYTDQNGLYVVENVPTPATQANRATFARTDTFYGKASAASIVSNQNVSMKRDVHGVPNEWVFIQQGLTFQPVPGSGMYVVNNTTHQPSDQTTIGRVYCKVVFLNASGQTDLQTQGDAYVLATYAAAEAVHLETAPWPAWHYDVLQYTDDAMPNSNVRKLQAQSWSLPLEGDKMTWETFVVGAE